MSQEHSAPPPRYLGFVAGMFSGVAKNLVGHPFDTIKVRLQTSDGRFKGPMDCVLKTWRNEGLRGFYKGCTPPLVGWVIMDSVMLGSLHTYRRFLKENFFKSDAKLPLSGHCIAGLMSGLTVSMVAAPVEQVKARLQIQYDGKTKQYTGPVNCVSQLIKQSGIRGIYKGLCSTMIFRTNFVFWWGSYEIFTQWFKTNTSLSNPAINFWSGGLSASVFWIFAYPADVVKQVIMTDDVKNPKFKRWIHAVKWVYETRGLKGFVRGFGPSILRSFPANAAALAAFEAVMRTLH
ncbi:hypothetical protein BABINDRAFT_160871 [Babjeviella inositovora NRRL Y-12698]|uniref:Mitochondrial carrier protein n=1 Tax=Babjeviella inositovora NRRL Y-12698 TaxID=984486 RepID=A0A1E3QSD7_9ASCO|nr:uncharacterized protein BABINDRAFT_160871 [Babjeviella inositovora NRRL Y-12698]ODQ80615.1 hypothetical protein BABINDRAFT_160871 [Babjeviella inositovora NRRL Y-12698]